MSIDVITIDGPAASGKSTIARKLAGVLGYQYLDTGAMYRALTWKALTQAIALTDTQRVGELFAKMDVRIQNTGDRTMVSVDGEDVTDAIRASGVTENVHHIASNAQLRAMMREKQREIGLHAPTVAEGRDMGTVVFPDARWKFYLDAHEEVRAQRRLDDLKNQGEDVLFEDVLAMIRKRDKKDTTRKVAPLKKADDATYIDSSNLSVDEVLKKVVRIIKDK